MLDMPAPATGVTAGTIPGVGDGVTILLATLPENWGRCTLTGHRAAQKTS